MNRDMKTACLEIASSWPSVLPLPLGPWLPPPELTNDICRYAKSRRHEPHRTLLFFAALGFFLPEACKAESSHMEKATPTFFFCSDAFQDRAHLTALPTASADEHADNRQKPSKSKRLWVEHKRSPTFGQCPFRSRHPNCFAISIRVACHKNEKLEANQRGGKQQKRIESEYYTHGTQGKSTT